MTKRLELEHDDTNEPMTTVSEDLMFELAEKLGLELNLHGQLVLSNYEDALSDWQFTVENLARLIEQRERAARADELEHLPLDGLIDQCFIAFAKRRDARIATLKKENP